MAIVGPPPCCRSRLAESRRRRHRTRVCETRVGSIASLVVLLGLVAPFETASVAASIATPARVGFLRPQKTSAPPLEAAWIDRTTPRLVDGWAVRSDLDRASTSAVLAELAALGRRFTDRFGPVSGRLQVWLFANATEASDTVRTLLGSPLDADRQAAFVQDPVGGGDGIVVVVPRSGDASLLHADLARAVAEYGTSTGGREQRPLPPWLAHGIVEWFSWADSPMAAIEGVRPPASLRRAVREAEREGRRFGVERLIRLDGPSWAANEAAGSGPLQRAEAGALVTVLMDSEKTRTGVQRMLTARMPPGTSPLVQWSRAWPGMPPEAFGRSVSRLFEPETSGLEAAFREAVWLADGRPRLQDGAAASSPEKVRAAIIGEDLGAFESCLAASGRCRMATPEPVVEWDRLEPTSWAGRAGRWRLRLEWRTLGARTIGLVSVEAADRGE